MKYKEKIAAALFVAAMILISGCSAEEDADVSAVSYSGGVISISLAATNKQAKEQVISRIRLVKGNLTGQGISFQMNSVPASTWEQKEYQLSGFSPALVSGELYFLIFDEAAFDNEGTKLGSASFSDGSSAGGVFQLRIP